VGHALACPSGFRLKWPETWRNQGPACFPESPRPLRSVELRAETNAAVFEVESGNYSFRAPMKQAGGSLRRGSQLHGNRATGKAEKHAGCPQAP
jgi:hypothetical protein